jgi:DNA ligase-1
VKSLPKLYKRTSTGKIQEWQVFVDGNQVITKFGQVGGKIQTTSDTVKGKNIGKINETTDEEQARLKAEQMWTKKVKDRYVEDISKAEAGESSVECFKPMLAHPIEKKEKYVTFPAIAQPKLDGLRCLAIIKDGVAKLYSRTGKPINTIPHINKELEELFSEGYEVTLLDGELYNHELKDDFNKIVSTIKREKVHKDHKLIQYHIYDSPYNYSSYIPRMGAIRDLLANHGEYLRHVEYDLVHNREELEDYFRNCLEAGYEGAMYRNNTMPYEHKRSNALLKVKIMDDDEFEVIDVQEGNGKLQGHAGAFICVTKEGKPFKAKMKGALDNLVEYYENFDKYKGKQLTVQFQGLTPDGIPRFPVGLRFREAE